MAARLAVKVDGRPLLFRLPSAAEVDSFVESSKDDPAGAFDQALALLTECCQEGDFDAILEENPLCVDRILPELFNRSNQAVKEQVRSAIRRWRAAETNLGRIAENILAFKAYQGGQASPQAFAGALHVAEWFDVTRGTFRLLNAFMKGLRKRK